MSLKGTLAFSSGKDGDYDIWTYNLESKHLNQLTSGEYFNDCPRWSPDGKQIVFISNRTGTPEIWLMNEDGSNQTQITKENRYQNTPDFSSDGKELVFSANYDGNIDIYTMNLDGTNREQITSYEGKDYTPHFSPDNNLIVYSSKESGNNEIWLYDRREKKTRQVTNYCCDVFSPAFSPDGETIACVSAFFNKKREENQEIITIDLNGELKTRETISKRVDRHVSWSPDGKQLVYTSELSDVAERIMIKNVGGYPHSQEVDIDRSKMDDEIESEPRGFGLFRFLPEGFRRMFYSQKFFGTERYPDWKF